MTGNRRVLAGLVSVCVLIAAPTPSVHAISSAMDGSDSGEPKIESLLADLDDTDYKVRERATRALSDHEVFSIDDITKLLSEEGLSLEQRQRLMGIARVLFEQTPRGGMGIQFMGQWADGGGVAVNVLENFPASRVLRNNDVMVKVAGAPVRDSEQIRLEVLARDPGQTLPVEVRRQGEVLELDVELGSHRMLDQNRTVSVDDQSMDRAWQIRRAMIERETREMADRANVIDARPSVEPAEEDEDSPEDPRAESEIPQVDAGDALVRSLRPVTGVVAGGEARGGVDRFGRARLRVAFSDIALPHAANVDDEAREAHRQALQMVRELDQQAAALRTRISQAEARVRDEATPDRERQRLANQANVDRARLEFLEREIEQIRGLIQFDRHLEP